MGISDDANLVGSVKRSKKRFVELSGVGQYAPGAISLQLDI